MKPTWTLAVSIVLGATAGVVGYIAHSLAPFVARQELAWACAGALLGSLLWLLMAARDRG